MSPGNPLERSVILIDKPEGLTSFGVVEKVSGLLGISKAGHAGTLDPNATGVMVIALGEARKAMPVLMGLDKEYVGVMRLHGDVENRQLKKTIKSFTGEITQVPPVKSRVARKPRKRRVHEIEILGSEGRDVTFRVVCQAGTYIRKLAHDIGEKLGTGAQLTELRRTKAGPFGIGECVRIGELDNTPKAKAKKSMMPLEKALDRIGLPKITIKDEYEAKIRNGSPVRKEFVNSIDKHAREGAYVGIFNENKKIIALGKFLSKSQACASTERVFNL